MKLRRTLLGLVGAVLPVVALATPVGAQAAQTGASVTYQINARHAPLSGLGAGGGLVVVPATHSLVAYGH